MQRVPIVFSGKLSSVSDILTRNTRTHLNMPHLNWVSYGPDWIVFDIHATEEVIRFGVVSLNFYTVFLPKQNKTTQS